MSTEVHFFGELWLSKIRCAMHHVDRSLIPLFAEQLDDDIAPSTAPIIFIRHHHHIIILLPRRPTFSCNLVGCCIDSSVRPPSSSVVSLLVASSCLVPSSHRTLHPAVTIVLPPILTALHRLPLKSISHSI